MPHDVEYEHDDARTTCRCFVCGLLFEEDNLLVSGVPYCPACTHVCPCGLDIGESDGDECPKCQAITAEEAA